MAWKVRKKSATRSGENKAQRWQMGTATLLCCCKATVARINQNGKQAKLRLQCVNQFPLVNSVASPHAHRLVPFSSLTASSARAHRFSSLPHCISTLQDELYCSLYLPVSFLFMQLRRRPVRAWIDIMTDGDHCRNVDISDQPKSIEMSTLDFV